ncbi:hypothetical protein TURU_109805 [Turdus rufiventris]|nr:hypothetical protein TURU_109805 [Turdus rufiventris]
MTSGVPPGSGLGPILFNTSITDKHSGIKGTLSKFATNTKLCGAVHTLERKDVIQRDLDRLERGGCANPMKAKVLYLSCSNPRQSYKLSGELIDRSPEEKGLGVMADEKCNMTQP